MKPMIGFARFLGPDLLTLTTFKEQPVDSLTFRQKVLTRFLSLVNNQGVSFFAVYVQLISVISYLLVLKRISCSNTKNILILNTFIHIQATKLLTYIRLWCLGWIDRREHLPLCRAETIKPTHGKVCQFPFPLFPLPLSDICHVGQFVCSHRCMPTCLG